MKFHALLLAFCVIACLVSRLAASDLHGRVVDEEGKPVAGARVDVATAAPKVGQGIFCPSCYLDCKKWTRSDERGEFVIRGLSLKLKFRILSTANGKQTHLSKLFDPDSGELSFTLKNFPADTPENRIIEGQVVTAQGVPIPGALIEPYGAETSEKRWWGPVNAQSAVTDDDGKFRMLLGEDFRGVDVKVSADELAGTRGKLLKPGKQTHRIVVPEGAKVTGKLVRDGKPLSGADVAVVQTERGVDNHFIKAVLATTDERGVFHFQALPASQEYVIFSPVGQRDGESHSETRPIVATKKFQVPEDGKTRDIGVVETVTGFDLTGKLVMTDGTPLPDGIKVLLGRDPAWDLVQTSVGDDGKFAFHNLPTETYHVTVIAKGLMVDATRVKRQTTSANAIGVRLKESTNVLIPLQPESVAKPLENIEKVPDRVAVNDPEPNPELTWINVAGAVRPKVELTDEPVGDDAPKLSARGILRDSQGHRVAGAMVVLRAKNSGATYDRNILARTTSDGQGQFLFEEIPIPIRMDRTITSLICGRGGAEIVALRDGMGISWIEVPQLSSTEPLQLLLEPEAECRGTVNDEHGNGIPGARIKLGGITASRANNEGFFGGPTDLSFPYSTLTAEVLTDPSGGFSLRNLPKNRRALVTVKADGFAHKILFLDTANSNGGTQAMTLTRRREQIPVNISPATVTLSQARTVTIRVVDHDDQPVQKGMIRGVDSKRREIAIEFLSQPGEARFPITEAGRYRFNFSSDPLFPHLTANVELNVEAGDDEPTTATIRLPEPRWLTGNVVNDAGQPLTGVSVIAFAYDENGRLRTGSTAVTRAKGEFSMPVVAGKVKCQISPLPVYGYFDMTAHSEPQQRNEAGPSFVEVNVPAAGDIPPVTLKASRGKLVEGTVVDADGIPVRGLAVRAEQIDQPYRSTAALTDEQGRFLLSGLSPKVSTLVWASTGPVADRILLKSRAEEQGDAQNHEQIKLVLRPGIQLTGRVLKNSRPVAGVKMELTRSFPDSSNRQSLFSVVTTDRDGRYVAGGLNAGEQYRFEIVAPNGMSAPNWQHQLPYVQHIPEGHVGQRGLPDANLVTYGQSLGGKIVDADGQPVVGYSVSAQLQNGMSVPRRENVPQPWIDSDQEGNFLLEQLPDLPLELMIYKSNPAGGRIRNELRVRPKQGDTQIRVVIDQSLNEGVESLDAP